MKTIRYFIFLLIVAAAYADEVAVTVLASLDSDRITATGLKTEFKHDMPDFSITYLHGPETGDVIGVYEGGHPSPFGTRGKKLGTVKDSIAGQSVAWICWSKKEAGTKRFGAETFVQCRKILVTMPGAEKEEFVVQFHIFVLRGDLKALATARTIAASLIKKGPNQSTPPP